MVNGLGISDPGFGHEGLEVGPVRPLESVSPEVAEANLAKDLAEMMEQEYARAGLNARLALNRSTNTGTVADACHLFCLKPRHPRVAPVITGGATVLVIRFR